MDTTVLTFVRRLLTSDRRPLNSYAELLFSYTNPLFSVRRPLSAYHRTSVGTAVAKASTVSTACADGDEKTKHRGRDRPHYGVNIMIDTTETNAVAAPVAEVKTKRTRGLLNKAYMQKLTIAEGVGQAAQHTSHAPALAARDITAESVTDLLEDTDDARLKAGAAIQHTTAKKEATAADYQAAHDLLAALQEVQKAAKQKYSRTNRIALDDYFVGKKLNGNRPNLLQTSQSIITRLASDTLPGITAAKVTKLKNLRVNWIIANNDQTANGSAAQTTRAELKTLIKSIDDRKVAIQLAADAEWPHTKAENAATRKEFGLPPRRPFVE